MKKLVFGAAVVAAALTAFTGCAGKAQDQVTLKVWESLSGPDEFIKQAGEKYTAKHPNVKIEFINVELGDAAGQIALDGPAGTGADLFAAPHDKLGELVNGEHILETVNAEDLKKEVLGACLMLIQNHQT